MSKNKENQYFLPLSPVYESLRIVVCHYDLCWFLVVYVYVKGILSTTIVIFSYPKLLSFSVLTFIKWRLTPSYAAKDTIFCQKRPKTIIIRIIVQDNKNSNLFIWPSMWTRLEHAHCLETINNMWFLGKTESGLWRIQRERWIEVKYLPNGTNAGYM
jgi:hypothetical protein